ncbi:MAG: DNA translocase FtsK, partial [Aureliella sp.]
VNLQVKDEEGDSSGGKPAGFKKRDELYEAAVDVVVREGRGSVSLLQRALGIGYGRGARLIDFMAEDGIVGQYNGSQAREVVISLAQWEAMKGGGSPSDAQETRSAADGSEPARRNRIRRDDSWDSDAESDSPPPKPPKLDVVRDESDWDREDDDDQPYDHFDEEEEFEDELADGNADGDDYDEGDN